MAYFENFPTIDYDPIGTKDTKTIKDILSRVTVKTAIKKNHALFERYDIRDGETPESVAYTMYGSASLHWVVLMFNDIIDPFYGWPLSTRNFEAYIRDKYTVPEGIHHYEIAQSSGSDSIKVKVESDVVGASAISNYDYEAAINDSKKQIKLLQDAYIGQFISDFNEQLIS